MLPACPVSAGYGPRARSRGFEAEFSADAETAPQGAVGVNVARCNEAGCPVARAEGIAAGRRLIDCGTSGFSDLELISRELTGPMFNC